MSGVEIGIAVVSAVAALIAAYKDGSKIVDRIKKKRAKKGGALPPSNELDKALRDGEADITRVGDEGRHVPVDTEAAMALKDLIIEVQGTLLHQLAEAEQDDSFTDFSSTIQTAVRTRRKAINVLNDLYLRAEEKEEKDRLHEKEEQRQGQQEAASAEPVPVTRSSTAVEDEAVKDRSRLKFWSRPNTSDPPKPRQFEERLSKDKQSNDRHSKDIASPTTAPQSPSITRHSTTAFSDITRRSTWSITSPPGSPQQILALNKSNDFGGFCKGAWHAQNLNLAKAVGKPSLRSYGWAFHCTKCSYALQADVRDRNRPRFDDRVYKMEEMRFRLLLLLKSHLPQKASKDARKYGCLLCALAGGPAKKCAGEEHLFEHLQNHAMQTYGETLLAGPVSIGAESVLVECMATYDVVFDGGEDFVLPPSALEVTQSHESEPLNLVDEVFGNVWADQKS